MPRVEIEYLRTRRVEESLLLEVDITEEEMEDYENGDLDLWELYYREEVRTAHTIDGEWVQTDEDVDTDEAEIVGEVD